MPTGALSISIPDIPTTPTTTTKHSATRPTFFPTVAWWRRFPRPRFPSYYSSSYNTHGYRNDTHDENGRMIIEEGLLSDGEREDSDGMTIRVGMQSDSGSSYWKRVSSEGRRMGRLRLVVEILGAVGVIVAVVGFCVAIGEIYMRLRDVNWNVVKLMPSGEGWSAVGWDSQDLKEMSERKE
ncbi:hypothetical protein BPAE_0187g00150 [Botrytis paeoniae]|uniref:Uncharacterized protein n=1 Tax=Botrytis paeoniae TaxID=278948 RepID=A0A4Z1FC52_9HELO|nr:hypothetical protein BPAE_0187g00150 [Botrytis paeoniae]